MGKRRMDIDPRRKEEAGLNDIGLEVLYSFHPLIRVIREIRGSPRTALA